MQLEYSEEEKEFWQKALETWGTRDQVEQVMEELAELIVEINHFRRGKSDLEKLISEIADVINMIGQLTVMVPGLTESLILEECQAKIERTKGKLRNLGVDV